MDNNKKELQNNDKFTLTECNFDDVEELETAVAPQMGFGCGCGSWNLGIYCG